MMVKTVELIKPPAIGAAILSIVQGSFRCRQLTGKRPATIVVTIMRFGRFTSGLREGSPPGSSTEPSKIR
jgi:hypothetical protein